MIKRFNGSIFQLINFRIEQEYLSLTFAINKSY